MYVCIITEQYLYVHMYVYVCISTYTNYVHTYGDSYFSWYN